jgi:sugar phosphate isomerase/epimerase
VTLIDRRQFVRAAAFAAVAGPSSARAAEAPRRLSLAAYSFNRLLNLKAKPKPAMTLEEFIEFAAGTPANAVELTSYYFPESTPAYLDKIKALCESKKLAVSGSAVGNDFCIADDGKRVEQVRLVRDWIGHTARLGGKTLRIFAGKVPTGDTEAASLKRCIAAIREVADDAAKAGVKLGVENHGGITATPEQLLAIVNGVDHPAVGVNLDTGNFHGDDPYAELARVAPKAVSVQVKTEITRRGQKKEDADLKRVVEILNRANYRGDVTLEYEAAAEPRTAVPRHLAELKRLLG